MAKWDDLRWMAEIRFQRNDEEAFFVTQFEEFEDLGDIVERGPDWNLIESITVTLNRPTLEPTTKK